MADVVLPAASFLEKEGVRSWWMPLQASNRALTVGECKGDMDIGFELAKRFDPNFRWKDTHELFDEIIKPSGMTFDELSEKVWSYPPEGTSTIPYHRHEKGLLRSDGTPGFRTPSGRFELYSTHRESWNLEPMPLHEEPPFTPVTQPEKLKEYPLILGTGRRLPVSTTPSIGRSPGCGRLTRILRSKFTPKPPPRSVSAPASGSGLKTGSASASKRPRSHWKFPSGW